MAQQPRSPASWWRSISSPLRVLSPRGSYQEADDQDSSKRRGYPGLAALWRGGNDSTLNALLLFMLVPLGLGFLLLQGQLTFHAQTHTQLHRAAHRQLGNAVFPSELWQNLTNQAVSDTRNVGLGYVERTVAEGVINFLAQAEKELATDQAAEEAINLVATTAARLSPVPGVGPTVTKQFPARPHYTKEEEFEMTWTYEMDEKLNNYVGNKKWMDMFPKGSRAYYNSLATFGHVSNSAQPNTRYHGHVGVFTNGTQYWMPSAMPPPIAEVNRTEAMRRGGFYLDLANALPMDREPDDTRDEICKPETWDYSKLSDASIVITFFNEPLSTLLRSVHSVLNLTPPPLLREIILVDDHSDLAENQPGTELYEYLKLLPKTKLLRLPERRGLVWARLAGAQVAKAPVLVVLDSHVEMNYNWLEPQLARLVESPKSIVFPQIMALEADSFRYNHLAGIGCWLSWKWNMVEQASLTGSLKKVDPIASASMAGGLFAVNLDWFWELGGYDEGMSMWGSENVEMGFRAWMCGGRMECIPCARTYHIYRSGGSGYSSPPTNIWRNKLRVARLWMDEWFQVAQRFIGQPKTDLGSLDAVLELKQRLKCKPFSWFMEHVDPTHEGRDLNDLEILGEIRSVSNPNLCIDTLSHHKQNETWGVYSCHGGGGSQGFFKDRFKKNIKSFLDDTACLIINEENEPVFWGCHERHVSFFWTVSEEKQLVWRKGEDKEVCAAISTERNLVAEKCDSNAANQKWKPTGFKPDPNFKLPEFSEEYKRLHFDRPADSEEE